MEIVRLCLARTSLHPQVFSTSRRLVLSDTSQTYFSLVALVGLASFRGFSSLVADIDRLCKTPSISFRRHPNGSRMSGFLFRGCLSLLVFAQLGRLSPLARFSATCFAHLQGFWQPSGRPSAGSPSAHSRVPRSGLAPGYVTSPGLHLR
jgi:hypothetical protein